MIDQYLYSAIIGYWRCGADFELISTTTGINIIEIEKLIADYERNNQDRD
jgi:hypothetical protein